MRTGIDPTTHTLVVDNHSLDIFRTCPMKWQLQIQQALSLTPYTYAGEDPELTSVSIDAQFGIAVHKALNVLYLGNPLDQAKEAFLETFKGLTHAKLTPGRGCEILDQYYEVYLNPNEDCWDGIVVEQPFHFDIGKVLYNSDLWRIVYCGIIDFIGMREGVAQVMDHKTTGWNSTFLIPAYEVSNQFMGYAWALHQIQGKTQPETTAILDLIVINPKKTDLSRDEFTFKSSDLDEWKREIIQTSWFMLHCHHTSIFPRYGKEGCTKFNRLCHFNEICRKYGTDRTDVLTALYTTTAGWDPEKRS